MFWNAALQGTVAEPKLEGFDPRRCALVVSDRPRWSLAYDPQKTAEELLVMAADALRASQGSQAQVYRVAVATNEPRVVASNVPQPQTGPAERAPAVAGRFYPGSAQEITRMLDGFLTESGRREDWAAALVPHAGWIFSGRLAAAVLNRARIPSRVIVLAPKHHAQAPIGPCRPTTPGVCPAGAGGDPELAQRLAQAVSGLELDTVAHQAEHAVEVQLPILARLAPDVKVVGIALGRGDLPQLQRLAEQLAGVLQDLPERPLLVVSSDMSHEQNRSDNRLRTAWIARRADAMRQLDPARSIGPWRRRESPCADSAPPCWPWKRCTGSAASAAAKR